MTNKIVSIILSICFLFQQTGLVQAAAVELNLSNYFARMASSMAVDSFRPVHLRYFSYDSLNNSFKLLLDKGDLNKGLSPKGTVPEEAEQQLKEETKELLKYFLIGLTLPNDKFWVNLRPDSPKQIIDFNLEETDIGKIMLEADLQLKKDTAAFTSPQSPEGKEYWDRLYKKAEELYGQENITIPTLTRPWIVPNEIIVRETKDSAYIYKATLKVMLESDYLRDGSQDKAKLSPGIYEFKDSRAKALNEYSSQLIRELIIPKLTKEVNLAKRYAPLRQVYYSLILSRWFKLRFQGQSGTYPSLIDKNDLTNLTSKSTWDKNTYFNAYKKSFAEGEYNIQEPVYTPSGQTIRSYFSGGMRLLPPISETPNTGGFTGASPLLGKLMERTLTPASVNSQGDLEIGGQISASPIKDSTNILRTNLINGLSKQGYPLNSTLPEVLKSWVESITPPFENYKLSFSKEDATGILKAFIFAANSMKEKEIEVEGDRNNYIEKANESINAFINEYWNNPKLKGKLSVRKIDAISAALAPFKFIRADMTLLPEKWTVEKMVQMSDAISGVVRTALDIASGAKTQSASPINPVEHTWPGLKGYLIIVFPGDHPSAVLSAPAGMVNSIRVKAFAHRYWFTNSALLDAFIKRLNSLADSRNIFKREFIETEAKFIKLHGKGNLWLIDWASGEKQVNEFLRKIREEYKAAVGIQAGDKFTWPSILPGCEIEILEISGREIKARVSAREADFGNHISLKRTFRSDELQSLLQRLGNYNKSAANLDPGNESHKGLVSLSRSLFRSAASPAGASSAVGITEPGTTVRMTHVPAISYRLSQKIFELSPQDQRKIREAREANRKHILEASGKMDLSSKEELSAYFNAIKSVLGDVVMIKDNWKLILTSEEGTQGAASPLTEEDIFNDTVRNGLKALLKLTLMHVAGAVSDGETGLLNEQELSEYIEYLISDLHSYDKKSREYIGSSEQLFQDLWEEGMLKVLRQAPELCVKTIMLFIKEEGISELLGKITQLNHGVVPGEKVIVEPAIKRFDANKYLKVAWRQELANPGAASPARRPSKSVSSAVNNGALIRNITQRLNYAFTNLENKDILSLKQYVDRFIKDMSKVKFTEEEFITSIEALVAFLNDNDEGFDQILVENEIDHEREEIIRINITDLRNVLSYVINYEEKQFGARKERNALKRIAAIFEETLPGIESLASSAVGVSGEHSSLDIIEAKMNTTIENTLEEWRKAASIFKSLPGDYTYDYDDFTHEILRQEYDSLEDWYEKARDLVTGCRHDKVKNISILNILQRLAKQQIELLNIMEERISLKNNDFLTVTNIFRGTREEITTVSKEYLMAWQTQETKSNSPTENGSSPLGGIDTSLRSVSIPDGNVGGIDFKHQALASATTYETMGSFSGLDFSLPKLSSSVLLSFNLDKEQSDISRAIDNGILVSGQRIKEFMAASSAKGELEQRRETVITWLAKLGILEETTCCTQESSPEYREALVIADSAVI